VDDPPEVKYINRHVKTKVCAAGPEVWINLGVELLDEKDVEKLCTIKSDSAECDTRCSKMFELWLRRQPGASWRQLIVALKQIGLDKLASDVEKLLSVEQTSKEVAKIISTVL